MLVQTSERDLENSLDFENEEGPPKLPKVASTSGGGIASFGETTTDEDKGRKRATVKGEGGTTPERPKRKIFLASSLAGEFRRKQNSTSSGGHGTSSGGESKKSGSQSDRGIRSPAKRRASVGGGLLGRDKSFKTKDDDEESELSIGPEFEGLPLFKKDGFKDCSYCLRRELPLVLVLENCGHMYCPHCLIQQYHITTVTQGIGLPQPGKNGSQKLIRCYLCKQYHGVNELQIKQLHHLAKSKKVKAPLAKPPITKGLKRCQTCFRITLNVELIMDAGYECLNCNLLLCQQCLDIHFTNPKHEGHRVLRLLEEANLEQTLNDFCATHRERLIHYCFTDRVPLCVVCVNYDDHASHEVKPLK
jgi:B-box zinc finger